jgi:hypothetical protein
LTGGQISAQGNISAQGIVSAIGNIVTSANFVGNFLGNITGNLSVGGANTQVLFNANGNVGAAGGLTYDSGSNVLTVLGTVSAQGNINASGRSPTDSKTSLGVEPGNVFINIIRQAPRRLLQGIPKQLWLDLSVINVVKPEGEILLLVNLQ